MRKLVTGLVAAAVLAVTALAAPQLAHAWGEAEYTGAGQPRFNTYTNVPNVGDEHDWVRIGKNGALTSTFNNKLDACDGEARVSMYIHNGAPEGFNGTNNDGTGVAKDTRLNVTVPKTSADPISATVSASNAPSVSDTANITCNGEAVELEYVPGTAEIFSQLRDRTTIDGLVNNGGTLIGSYSNNGVVPGCWDFRVYVTLVVKVKKIEKKTPAVTCDLLEAVLIGKETDNKYKFVGHATAKNADLKNFVFNLGNGTTETVAAKDGKATSKEYTFTADTKVSVSVVATADKKDLPAVANDKNCVVQIRLNKPPVVPMPPTKPVASVSTIPQTGPASTIGMVSAISALAYGFRRWLDSRAQA